MKNVGIPRRLDELGRIVIPIDVRRALSLNERDTVMFFSANCRRSAASTP